MPYPYITDNNVCYKIHPLHKQGLLIAIIKRQSREHTSTLSPRFVLIFVGLNTHPAIEPDAKQADNYKIASAQLRATRILS